MVTICSKSQNNKKIIHDCRNELNCIKMCVEIIANDGDQDIVSNINNAISNINNLISNI